MTTTFTMDMRRLPTLPQICVATGATEPLWPVTMTAQRKQLSPWTLLTIWLGRVTYDVTEHRLSVPIARDMRVKLLAAGVVGALVALAGLVGAFYAAAQLAIGPMVFAFAVTFAAGAAPWLLRRRVYRLRVVDAHTLEVTVLHGAVAAAYAEALAPGAEPAPEASRPQPVAAPQVRSARPRTPLAQAIPTSTASAVKFACPHCEHVSKLPESYAGRKGRCTRCREVLRIPEPRYALHTESSPQRAGRGRRRAS
jgi:hypothetical protein